MDLLALLFVGKPLNILVVAALFLLGYLVMRFMTQDADRPHWPMLVAAAAWVLYAVWEFAVNVRTPEANIRVDLLVIWPSLAILSAWAIYRALQGKQKS